MPLQPGQLVTLTIEKPAAGGRMIARADGQVVLVRGAIPGERVTARVERVGKGVAYADTTAVDEPSLDRRDPFADPLCGGCLFAHISYSRQIEIKAQIVADAFARIGRIALQAPVAVAASPDEGYRMRARLHVRGGHVGFFREGTHDMCEARATKQLLPATCDCLDGVGARLRSLGAGQVHEIEVSENIAASERVVHLHAALPFDPRPLASLAGIDGLTGMTIGGQPSTAGGPSSASVIAGQPFVTDTLSIDGHDMAWRHHVLAFFQGNRYLLHDLVASVVAQIDSGRETLDLYAGAGLFSVPAAIVRGARVVAVEGDRLAAADLQANAKQAGAEIDVRCQPVETLTHATVETIIVDPPRTGMSREALDKVTALGARRILYVSCDVATLARDAKRLVEAGYTLDEIRAFDMFPNTPHIETVVKFEA